MREGPRLVFHPAVCVFAFICLLPGTAAATPDAASAAAMSARPAQRAAAVSGEVALFGMEPQFVIVGQPTRVSVHGQAFSDGTELRLNAGGFQIQADNVQRVTSELLVGDATLPEAAVGPVAVSVHRPDGSAATLLDAAQAHEVYWGLQTSDGTVASGRLGSLVPLWIGEASGAELASPPPSLASEMNAGIADCQRISFCTLPQQSLGDFRPSYVSPNKCDAAQELPGINTLTYFWCTAGPCTPSSPYLITDKDVALKVYPRYWTGGHCHSQADRPNGSPDSAQGNTGATGLGFRVPHTWPDVAGAVNVVVYSTDPSWQMNALRDTNYVYCVQEPGLIEMQPGTGYALTGGRPWHPFNHFAGMGVIEALMRLVQDVQASLPSAIPLRFNDMDLVSGGLLDLDQHWNKPHCSHRGGANVDLGIKQMAASPADREYLEALCRKQGFNVAEEDSGGTNWHWHLTYKNPPKERK